VELGGSVITPTVIILDTFTDTNGTLLDAHTPVVDNVGNGWVLNLAKITVESNKAKQSVDDAAHTIVASIDGGVSDGELTCSITTPSAINYTAGLIFRRKDDGTSGLVYLLSNSAPGFYEMTGDDGLSAVIVSSGVTFATSTTYDIKIVLDGNSIKIYVDGSLDIDTTYSTDVSETNFGLWSVADVSIPINPAEFDNFELIN